MEKIWMKKASTGETREVEAIPEILYLMMVQKWRQCPAPEKETHWEVNDDAR